MRRYLQNWKGVIYNLAFFLNGLLIFLLFFEKSVAIPAWMFPIGRLHPAVLHFPLVVLLLYAFWTMIVEKEGSARWNVELADTLLLLGTFTASVAAFSGFLLSKEDSDVSQTLQWHKWLGVSISIGSIAWYGASKYLLPWRMPAKLFAGAFLGLLLVTGHLGGNLTHGEDFLALSPPNSTEAVNQVSIEQAEIYENLVKPVLQQKCYACHNADKSKGGLQMHTKELLAKGGKNGMLWDTTKPDLGLLINRVHLPLEDKKHMPPKGKVQLTDEEVVLLAEWIRLGSDFKEKVTALPPQNPVYRYAENVLGGNRTGEVYDFAAADPANVKALNTNYRTIRQYAPASPALFVNFYNRSAFKSSDISDLLPIKDQIVAMDFSKMPVKDEDLKVIAKFPELRKLILNFTELRGSTLGELRSLSKLRVLALSGTGINNASIKTLNSIASLEKVYLWSTGLTTEEQTALRADKKIRFETGFRSDTVRIALNPPTIENEQQIVMGDTRVRLKHQIPGTQIRYTLDGTVPDSTRSPIYNEPILLTNNALVIARAFKSGWYGSSSTQKNFIKANYKIDSVNLVSLPDPKYKAKAGTTLIDGIKSAAETGSGNWLGYRDADFESYFYFSKPVAAKGVTVSMLQNIAGFIFPPARIEVWGGADEHALKLLKVIHPALPARMIDGTSDILINASFEAPALSCLKIVAKPIPKIPAWHPGKGAKGWVFVDEVIVN
ncbi:FN3 associated domain-containing protein [Dyadobacter sp. CY261]|uniref:FN3 associated domain-containing protein n=1 Tax=Dyadobacter sp. CY261 TaxID=2907203 RepID=UPI001F3D1E9A|nr:FN3 associated domain-containing protein [Dyadobacter sp. CY261]